MFITCSVALSNNSNQISGTYFEKVQTSGSNGCSDDNTWNMKLAPNR